MTSKQRVHAAIKKESTDRVPIFMWFHPGMAKRLSDVLEIPSKYVGEAMGDDIRQTWVGNNHAMEGIVHDFEGETHTDDWGLEWIKIGHFNQIKHSPLQDADEEKIKYYQFPVDKIENLLKNMESILPFANEYFIGCDASPSLFELLCRVRGMEHAIYDLVSDSPAVCDLKEKAKEFSIKLGEKACDRFELDWYWTGDDVGGQEGLIMSPSCWREKIKPGLSEIFKIGKQRNICVAYHSCGAIRSIIPDLIEIGMDVLNPMQNNCPGMNTIELKKEFGNDITFMGGVDTQELLPNCSAEMVHRETVKLLEGMMSDGGGYILAASHTVPPETPLENVFAIYKAAGVSKQEILDHASDIRNRLSER